MNKIDSTIQIKLWVEEQRCCLPINITSSLTRKAHAEAKSRYSRLLIVGVEDQLPQIIRTRCTILVNSLFIVRSLGTITTLQPHFHQKPPPHISGNIATWENATQRCKEKHESRLPNAIECFDFIGIMAAATFKKQKNKNVLLIRQKRTHSYAN